MTTFFFLYRGVQYLRRSSPSKSFSGAPAERSSNRFEVICAIQAEIGALWEVVAQQTIGVLIRATLPWAVGITKVDRKIGSDRQFGMTGHL